MSSVRFSKMTVVWLVVHLGRMSVALAIIGVLGLPACVVWPDNAVPLSKTLLADTFDGDAVDPLASKRHGQCVNNLKQSGLILKMYSNEAPGNKWPPLRNKPGYLVWDPDSMGSEYLPDPTILICSGDRKRDITTKHIEDPDGQRQYVYHTSSYWYLGYAIPDEETGLAFVEAYKKQAETGEGFEADLQDEEGNLIYRLREDLLLLNDEDLFCPRARAQFQSTLPVMIERPGNHNDKVNVLFMDGRVETLTYPGEFPVSQRFIEALQSITVRLEAYDEINPQGGEVVDGLQVFIQAKKEHWAVGEIPELRVDFLEVDEGTLYAADPPMGIVVEYDGVNYTHSASGLMSEPGLFHRGLSGLQGTLDGTILVDEERRPLTLTLGKHTVRVGFYISRRDRSGRGKMVYSNPVTIEIDENNAQ